MELHCVNLYDYFSQTKPENGNGELICYCTHTTREMTRRRKRPAVLVIPGGGYCMVSERESEPVALRYLIHGYVPFVLRYSCVPNKFPVQLREAAMAMRYIREHAEEFEVDPNMVAAVGFSAGGHLCGTLGTMYDCPEVADIGDAALIRPNALGLCYAVLLEWGITHSATMENVSGGDPDLRRRLSVDKQVRPDMPPVFLWHTRNDQTVPCRNSLIFAQKLDEIGVEFALHLYNCGDHGLSLANDQVYGAVNPLTKHSQEIHNWVENCVEFWREVGLNITDM